MDLLRSVHEDLDELAKTKSVTILFAARPGTHLSDSMAWVSAADVSSLATDEIADLRSAGQRLAGMCAELAALRLAAGPAVDRSEPRDQLRVTVVCDRSPDC